MISLAPSKAQVAALPVRGAFGSYEVLLVTSRETKRWVIPKGWPMKGKKDYQAAAQEAFEEAGVKGRIHRHPMGAYTYEKRVDNAVYPVRAMVYLLEVETELKVWPEKDQRKRVWMSVSQAAPLIEEPGLIEILARLNAMPDALGGRQA